MLTELLNAIYKKFAQWVDKAINWAINFLSKVLQVIKNWFDALYDYIQELLQDNDETVIIDQSTDIGAEMFEMIKEHCPKTTSINKYNRDGKIVMGVNDGTITKVEEFEAIDNQNGNTDFDKDLARDGIIRMTA